MLIHKSAHEDANIIFGAVIDKNMDEEMRVTVIATGCQAEYMEEREIVVPLRRLEPKRREPAMQVEEPEYNPSSLKTLAKTIKKESAETFASTSNFDIPTFLRKHAD